ncbi:hypothetical protein HAX54_046327 [Datura stramonium]|uniref:Uncharacterized protein n=1 Tax=Datura stramonium TaxID=4076 RepID=A0ABS8RPS0_DATST|nr:hypothetical protein [Datura stramonium]
MAVMGTVSSFGFKYKSNRLQVINEEGYDGIHHSKRKRRPSNRVAVVKRKRIRSSQKSQRGREVTIVTAKKRLPTELSAELYPTEREGLPAKCPLHLASRLKR